MSEAGSSVRHGVLIWAQIVVWSSLAGLIGLAGFGLKRARQGTVQPGDKIPDFGLTLLSGHEYNGQSEVTVSDLLGKLIVE